MRLRTTVLRRWEIARTWYRCCRRGHRLDRGNRLLNPDKRARVLLHPSSPRPVQMMAASASYGLRGARTQVDPCAFFRIEKLVSPVEMMTAFGDDDRGIIDTRYLQRRNAAKGSFNDARHGGVHRLSTQRLLLLLRTQFSESASVSHRNAA